MGHASLCIIACCVVEMHVGRVASRAGRQSAQQFEPHTPAIDVATHSHCPQAHLFEVVPGVHVCQIEKDAGRWAQGTPLQQLSATMNESHTCLSGLPRSRARANPMPHLLGTHGRELVPFVPACAGSSLDFMRVYGQLASRLQHIMMKRGAFPTTTHAGQLLRATPSMTEEQRWVPPGGCKWLGLGA